MTTTLYGTHLGSQPLIIAGAVSFALHGGILATASWLWSPTALPQAPSLVVITMAPESVIRNSKIRVLRQYKSVTPTIKPRTTKKNAFAALLEVKQPPQMTPKRVRRKMPPPVWGKTPPVPPVPPSFRQQRIQKTPQQVFVKSQTPDHYSDKQVVAKFTPAIAGLGGKEQTAMASEGTIDPSLRQRPVADLVNPAPAYPWISRRYGEQGRVILDVSVTSEGRANAVRIKRSSGSARLDRAALAAVLKWRFSPARRGGQSIAGRIEVPISFRLTK